VTKIAFQKGFEKHNERKYRLLSCDYLSSFFVLEIYHGVPSGAT
jgi:hypothetical protein